MEEIDKLFDRIDKDPHVDQIRLDIADLIAKCLNSMRDSFGYWEKVHMANAIAWLVRNANASLQYQTAYTTSWLRLSLVNVEKALVPPDRRSADYMLRDQTLDALTFDHLLEDIRKLGATSIS